MDKKEALKLVSKQLPLFSVPKKFWKDKKFMLEAVKIDSHAYAYDFIDKSLKKDKKITLIKSENKYVNNRQGDYISRMERVIYGTR